MDKETLRSLVSITTSKMPYFNLEDGKFENAIQLLGLEERWAFIENYFKDKELADGTVISVLAGTSDPEKFDYLQLY